ncbi:MAG: zf-TFIIB domain-containing protein [Actinomycetota bacterium]
MKCPQCSVSLVMSDRQGIEIDYCPDCRGVWLDRGELDKLIERSNAQVESVRRRDNDDDDYKPHKVKYPYPPKKKKLSSVLGDILDFG